MDLIDRQAVDKIIDDLLENDNLQASPSVWHGLHMIKQLPSAQPEKTCEYWDSESGFCALHRPSAQPYTDDEIQKMQDLEQAQIQKAYELGREDAQPERKTGEWIVKKLHERDMYRYAMCDQCGQIEGWDDNTGMYCATLGEKYARFCPYCGCRMKEAEHE